MDNSLSWAVFITILSQDEGELDGVLCRYVPHVNTHSEVHRKRAVVQSRRHDNRDMKEAMHRISVDLYTPHDFT